MCLCAAQSVKEDNVAAVRWIHYAYLAHFARPRGVRKLYRLAKRLKVCRIVEVGISDLERTVSLIRVAQRYAAGHQVHYTGLDWFDARPAGQRRLTLKEAHRTLRRTDARVRLVPGEPAQSLGGTANALLQTGLVAIAPTVEDSSLAPYWTFVPRMLDTQSVVLRETRDAEGEPTFRQLSVADVARLASPVTARAA